MAGISELHAAAWESLISECARLEIPENIESILGRLRLKIDAADPADITLGLDYGALVALEATLRTTIAALVSPPEKEIPDQVPHDVFARWVRSADRRHPVEIFTTNYDILFERSLERVRAPFFDGFVGSYRPYFSPDAIDVEAMSPGRNWTRFWKLHGSTNWLLDGTVPIRRTETGLSDMILPSHRKYDESRKMPYLALMDRLKTCLSSDGTLLVTCGYSWNDQHINSTILTALEAYPGNAAVALIYDDLQNLPHLVEMASHHGNLVVVGPREGVLQMERGAWALPGVPSRATASFLDVSFDSDAVPEEPSGSIPGMMRLGDFNIFCDFLSAMHAPGERS